MHVHAYTCAKTNRFQITTIPKQGDFKWKDQNNKIETN